MSAIQFLRCYFPAVFAHAQKIGIGGQALFDAGRLFERHFGPTESFEDGGGI